MENVIKDVQEMTELQELKNIELDLFRQFLRVCEKLNLRYYLLGGTLLGAVRHGGFIPWDDDIDVGMPRADYEVLLKECQALLQEPCFLQTNETDPEFPANFAKIRNSNTTFMETSLRNCKMNHGVYIDIFPLDCYPDGKLAQARLQIRNFFMMGRISGAFYFPQKQKLKSRIKQRLGRMMYPSLSEALRKRDELFKGVTEGSRIVNHCGAWGSKEIVPAPWYGEGTQLQFEGLTVWGPKEYDKWLTQVYGDYMQLPPPEKRKGHHFCDRIDLNRSYKTYMEA